MKPPEIPSNEPQRLAALRRYHVLDTPPEPRFDAITKLAAHILGVPIALISLIDTDRQWFKSRYGLDAPETPRDVSFCGHTLFADSPLIVNDSFKDDRFFDNPLATGEPRVRFYAGIPLRTTDGFVLGTLCAIDNVPRDVTDAQLNSLKLLADQVVEILELQRKHTESQGELRDFVENANVPLRWVDANGVVIWANDAELTMLGYSRDEYVGHRFCEFMFDSSGADEHLQQLNAGQTFKAWKRPVVTKNGSVRTLLVDSTPYFYDGLFRYTRSISRDVTDEEKRVSELETHKSFFELTLDLLCMSTSASMQYFALLNPAWEKALGWTVDELRARPFSEFVHPDDLKKTIQISKDHRDGGSDFFSVENRYRHKDGHWVVLSWVGTISDGVVYGAARDVTAERKIRHELNQFKETLDRTTDSILIFDAVTLQFQYANHGATAQLGYTQEELLARTPMDLNAEFDEASYRKRLEPLVTGAVPMATYEAVHHHKKGHAIPVEVSIQYIAGLGEDPRFVKISRNIADRQRVDKLKSEFVSMVSHELRTPLTAIRGALGLVANGITGVLPEQAQEYVNIALANSERLGRLINDILDLDKIQSGDVEMNNKLVDLAEVIKQAIRTNVAISESNAITINFVPDPRKIEVLADEDRLIQVLTNLISNAVKFSSSGQTVELSVVGRCSRIRVSVRDHGPGVAPEFRNRIFQRFAQADSSTTRSTTGTGLGLSISKGLIEQMNGDIGFENAEGGGAIFYFDLPWLPCGQATCALARVPKNAHLMVCQLNSEGDSSR